MNCMQLHANPQQRFFGGRSICTGTQRYVLMMKRSLGWANLYILRQIQTLYFRVLKNDYCDINTINKYKFEVALQIIHPHKGGKLRLYLTFYRYLFSNFVYRYNSPAITGMYANITPRIFSVTWNPDWCTPRYRYGLKIWNYISW